MSKLQQTLDALGIEAEIVEFDSHVRTADEAKSQIGITKDRIIKSILLILGNGKPILCILRGSLSVDFKKIRDLFGVKNVRMATPEEVLEHTGYEVGAVPPLVPGLETIIDSECLGLEQAYAGGGSLMALLKISPKDVLALARKEGFSREAGR